MKTRDIARMKKKMLDQCKNYWNNLDEVCFLFTKTYRQLETIPGMTSKFGPSLLEIVAGNLVEKHPTCAKEIASVVYQHIEKTGKDPYHCEGFIQLIKYAVVMDIPEILCPLLGRDVSLLTEEIEGTTTLYDMTFISGAVKCLRLYTELKLLQELKTRPPEEFFLQIRDSYRGELFSGPLSKVIQTWFEAARLGITDFKALQELDDYWEYALEGMTEFWNMLRQKGEGVLEVYLQSGAELDDCKRFEEFLQAVNNSGGNTLDSLKDYYETKAAIRPKKKRVL